MNQAEDWDPVLVRQLKRLGLSTAQQVPTADSWSRFLRVVHEHYRHVADDRALLNRSLELSTQELDDVRAAVELQRDQLRGLILGVADALGWFGSIVGADGERAPLDTARTQFADRLQALFGNPGADADTGQFSGMHTNLVKLADELFRLLSETAERASLKKELEVASAVQHMLVPGTDVLDRPGARVAGHFRPAAECGGDWWSVYELPEGRLLTIIGDVTGHGVSSAILTGAAKSACDVACAMSSTPITADALLSVMNATIHSTGRRQIMMTCAATVLDPATRSLTIANAGHPLPYVLRGNHLRTLSAHGQPLGAAEVATYEPATVTLQAGDVVVLFTDGLVETENDRAEQFGERRLKAVCQRAAPQGAVAVRDAIVEAFDAFRGNQPPADDVTLVVTSIK